MHRPRKRTNTTVAAAALALGAGLFAAGAQAQDVKTLRLSFFAPATHVLMVTGIEPWARSIEEASNGTLKIEMYSGSTLGKQIDHYDMAESGISDISFTNIGIQPGRFPIHRLLSIPGVFRHPKGATLAFEEWYRPYAEDELSGVMTCNLYVNNPNRLHSNVMLDTAASLDGLRLRTSTPAQSQFFSELGAVIVPTSPADMRPSVERGLVGAVTSPWESMFVFGVADLLHYHMEAPVGGTPFGHLFNKDTYNGLTDVQKAAIDQHCTPEWSLKIAEGWADQEDEAKAKFESMEGHSVYMPSEDVTAALDAVAEPMKEAWADAVREAGHDPDKIRADLEAALAKHGGS